MYQKSVLKTQRQNANKIKYKCIWLNTKVTNDVNFYKNNHTCYPTASHHASKTWGHSETLKTSFKILIILLYKKLKNTVIK